MRIDAVHSKRLFAMRRMLISVAGGLGLPIAFYNIADSLGAYLYRLQMKTAAKAVVYAFGWPLILWDWIFGRPADCSSCIHPYAIVAAVITYFVFFALLTYFAQVVIGKFWARVRPARNVSLSAGRA